jgi:H+-transporting ATPase
MIASTPVGVGAGAQAAKGDLKEALVQKPENEDDFPLSHGITNAEAAELLKQWGRNELPEKVTPSWLVFLQQMWAPMPIMIWCEPTSACV